MDSSLSSSLRAKRVMRSCKFIKTRHAPDPIHQVQTKTIAFRTITSLSPLSCSYARMRVRGRYLRPRSRRTLCRCLWLRQPGQLSPRLLVVPLRRRPPIRRGSLHRLQGQVPHPIHHRRMRAVMAGIWAPQDSRTVTRLYSVSHSPSALLWLRCWRGYTQKRGMGEGMKDTRIVTGCWITLRRITCHTGTGDEIYALESFRSNV